MSGRLKDDKKLNLVVGQDLAGGEFTITDGMYYDTVTFWSEGNGILRYSYDRNLTKEASMAVNVVALGISIYIMYIAGGALGLPIPALA